MTGKQKDSVTLSEIIALYTLLHDKKPDIEDEEVPGTPDLIQLQERMQEVCDSFAQLALREYLLRLVGMKIESGASP